MKPNWFVAFPVPAQPWLSPLLATAPASLRRFHPLDLHLTVAFLGPVSQEQAQQAWRRALEAPPAAVEITFQALEPFGRPSAPSAFALTPGLGREALVRYLAQQRDALLAAAGRPPEGRKPRPHVTVARPGRKASPALIQEALAWLPGAPIPAQRLRLDRLALYTWSEDRRRRLFQVTQALSLAQP